MSDAKVSICIPAWNAEGFINRTLDCARAQTYGRINILVSVDLCDDGTAAVCRRHAGEDQRVRVFTQTERLGWAGNVNFLLDRLDTEFYFLYFHDDLIAPNYTQRLLGMLRERPDAASVHCDMGHFGASGHVSSGRSYEGTAARRLITFLVGPGRGSPLRSLTRSMVSDAGLRMPIDAEGGLWANHPYLMGLIAAGPALHVPEVLYQRWDQRRGGLTDGWKRFNLDQIAAGYRVNARCGLEIIHAVAASGAEREILTYCLYLYLMQQYRNTERQLAVPTLAAPDNLAPEFADIRLPQAFAEATPDVQTWLLQGTANLLLTEGTHACEKGDPSRALSAFAAAAALDPNRATACSHLAHALKACKAETAALAVAHRARLLNPNRPEVTSLIQAMSGPIAAEGGVAS